MPEFTVGIGTEFFRFSSAETRNVTELLESILKDIGFAAGAWRFWVNRKYKGTGTSLDLHVRPTDAELLRQSKIKLVVSGGKGNHSFWEITLGVPKNHEPKEVYEALRQWEEQEKHGEEDEDLDHADSKTSTTFAIPLKRRIWLFGQDRLSGGREHPVRERMLWVCNKLAGTDLVINETPEEIWRGSGYDSPESFRSSVLGAYRRPNNPDMFVQVGGSTYQWTQSFKAEALVIDEDAEEETLTEPETDIDDPPVEDPYADFPDVKGLQRIEDIYHFLTPDEQEALSLLHRRAESQGRNNFQLDVEQFPMHAEELTTFMNKLAYVGILRGVQQDTRVPVHEWRWACEDRIDDLLAYHRSQQRPPPSSAPSVESVQEVHTESQPAVLPQEPTSDEEVDLSGFARRDAEISSRNEEIISRLSTIMEEVEQNEERLRVIERDIGQASRAQIEAEKVIRRLEPKLEEARKDLAQAERRCADLEHEDASVKQRIEGLETEAQNLTEERHRLETEQRQMREKARALEVLSKVESQAKKINMDPVEMLEMLLSLKRNGVK